MKDIFDKYEINLELMSREIDTTVLQEFNILRGRLIENINRSRLYGDTPTRQSDRAMVIDSLNRIAIEFGNKSFTDFSNQENSLINGIDVAVYIALSEEFNYIIKELGKGFKSLELPDIAISIYYGSLKAFNSNKNYKVIVIPAGKMGNTRAGNVMSAILTKYRPKNVVVIGLAGSISNDLQPGDVFIPDSVFEYLANSETSGMKKMSFIPSGNQLPTDPRLLNRFQLFRTNYPQNFKQWKKWIKKQINLIIDEETQNALNKIGFNFPLECKLVVGDERILGSGPAVGKGKAFIKWIIGAKRKVVALEMESAGVYDAAFTRNPAPKTIAIRGISDFADDRKKKIDIVGKGCLRILAVKNASSLLKFSIRAGLFE